jgi:hypothetical protein
MYYVTTKREANRICREVEAQGYDSIVTREWRYVTTARGVRRTLVYRIVCRYDGR